MNKSFYKYYICLSIITLISSFYPLYMGVRVVTDMLRDGTVLGANYPKYIIPYTPVSLAILAGVLIMPLILKYTKLSLLVSSIVSVGIFFISELLFEEKVIITDTVSTTLESWQMYMCYVPPESYVTRTWKAVDILIGNYSPTFKIHFYIISLVLILTFLNCFYGFGQMIISGNKKRLKALILQSASSVIFLGLCIFACFTAFFRDGEITVSPISAVLMCVFFVIFGVTMGIYAGSFLLGRKKLLSVVLPAVIASATTLVMYIGEMFLLSGHLYRFGSGFFFEGFLGMALAPADFTVILLAGVICGWIFGMIRERGRN